VERREIMSIVKSQLKICPYFGLLIAFRYVCDVKSHQGFRQEQQINFTKATALTRFTTGRAVASGGTGVPPPV